MSFWNPTPPPESEMVWWLRHFDMLEPIEGLELERGQDGRGLFLRVGSQPLLYPTLQEGHRAFLKRVGEAIRQERYEQGKRELHAIWGRS